MLDEVKQQDIEEKIPFISEPTDLYLPKKKVMGCRKVDEENGYDLGCRRLVHCPNSNIWKTIPFTKVMGKLLEFRYNDNDKCWGCMIGKSILLGIPGLATRAAGPMFDQKIISSVTSLEGYNADAF